MPQQLSQAAVARATEVEDAEAKALRKAAKRVAKMAAQAGEEAEPEVEDAEAKAARKAARKALKAKQAEEAALAEKKKTQKGAKKAGKGSDSESVGEQVERESAGQKRKLGQEQPGEQVSAKKLKAADGAAVASNVLGQVAYCKAHEIIAPAGCPEPWETFEAAAPEFGKKLEKALFAQGYAAPTPIQAQGWPIVMQGKDIVAVAKTGSGKTCAFIMPALARIAERGPAGPPKKVGWYSDACKPSVLVLAPTRELAQQIAGEAAKFSAVVGAKVVAIYGGVPKGDQVRELRNGCDVLIATPGRLIDLMTGAPALDIKPCVSVEAVTYLVLDEADRMLDMGFEPAIRQIVGACPVSGKPETSGGAPGLHGGVTRQTLFFTATWPKDVQKTAASLTSREAVQVRIGQGSSGDKLTANEKVTQVVKVTTDDAKPDLLREILKEHLKEGETAIVFCGMKIMCDKVEREIQKAQLGCWVRAIHSGKDQWVRDEVLAKFRQLTAGTPEGKRGVLVATDVASRGLDIPGVAMVIVYDFGRASTIGQDSAPAESWVHRVGRTGRAGKTGRAFTFFTKMDRGAHEVCELIKGVGQQVPKELEELGEAEWWEKGSRRKSWSGGKNRGKGKGKGGKGGKGKGK